MPSHLDFSAELSSQLQQAAAKMKAMRETARQGQDAATAPPESEPGGAGASPHEAPAPSPAPEGAAGHALEQQSPELSPIPSPKLSDTTGATRPAHRPTPPPAPRQDATRAGAASPVLSRATWAGGVRGRVLDTLRELAGGEPVVLVNLKRLAACTGIPYGSVRNAMSKLAQSGDIATRQVRMADGHGVRVHLVTARGEEGCTPPRPRRVAAHAGDTPPAPRDIWHTTQAVFALAWPYAAQAGLDMQAIAGLRAVFTAQGFDATALPLALRAFDRYLEATPPADAPAAVRDFLRCLQRQGQWQAPGNHGDTR